MKHVALILLASLTLAATAQTTFNVDMSCAPEFDNVFVTGPFCGWCANEDYNTLTDDDGDGIYTVVIEDLTGTVEYKYAINGFADQENLVNDMVDGADCAPVTDYAGYASRQTEAGTTTSDFYGTCDGTCNDLPGGAITFQVDMAGYTGTYSSVNLNGSFNGWCGSCAVMTDGDGDGVYSIEVGLDAGTVEYKFTVDGWTDQEMFAEGTACTSTIDGYTNRTFDVTGGDVVLDVVCWNLCTGCVVEPVTGCSADHDFMGELFGVSPNPALGETFVEGQVNHPYEDVFHVIWPTSTGAIPGAPLDVPLDSLILESLNLVGEMGETITLLEVGLSMSPNNNGDSGNPNTFLGGGQYCASVTGVPDTVGVFMGQFFTTAWVTVPVVGPTTIPFPLEGYTLVINPEPVPGCTDDTACNYDEAANEDDGSCVYSINCDGTRTVFFQVDMSQEVISPFGVHVAGDFQGWDPFSTEMLDLDSNLIYEVAYDIPDTSGQITYKFINGDSWADPNELIDPACGDSTGNRTMVIDSLAEAFVFAGVDEAGDPVCFNSCEACIEMVQVTFTVDMSPVSAVSPNGVHLAGSFQGWDPSGTPMQDNNDGTWSVTLDLVPGTYEFLFVNSNAWDFNQEDMSGSGCNNGGNRIATILTSTTYSACFNACPGASCVDYFGCTDPEACNFNVQALNEDGSCTYAAPGYCCDGGLDLNQNGICDQIECYGESMFTGGAISIPDVVGACHTGQIVVDAFAPGAVLADAGTGIERFFVNMEHSYLGDLDVTFICPNGQSLLVSSYPGPGTSLGVPVYGDSPPDPGTGWDYYWAEDATLGTWAEEPGYAGGSLPSGSYSSETSWDWLDGCPLNGVWQLELCDLWAVDNGFVFEWAIDFADSLAVLDCCDLDEDGICDDEDDCVFCGCTDPEAFNYDSEAVVEDGSCEYFWPTCEYIGSPNWSEVPMGVHAPDSNIFIHGEEGFRELVLNLPLLVQEPATGQTFAATELRDLEVTGLPPGLVLLSLPDSILPSNQACLQLTGIPELVGVYQANVSGELEVVLFGQPFVVGSVSLPFEVYVLPNPNPIAGCAYPNAVNYLAYATVDNGSCLYAGCTDPAALNYYSLFVLNDGSCIYGEVQDNTCPTDVDADGVVSTTDLLELLGTFGTLCD